MLISFEIRSSRLKRLGRAELAGERLLGRLCVDRDNTAGAGKPRARDDVQADAANPDHCDGVAGFHVGGIDRRARARDAAAAQNRGLRERQFVWHLGELVFVHE